MRSILPEKKNPMLRQMAHEVPLHEIKGKDLQSLIREMKLLLSKEEYGVALAASQVGEPVRLFIVSGRALARDGRNSPDEIAPESRRKKIEDVRPYLPDQVYINPEILKISRARKEKHEGCLSIRGKWGTVMRAEKATVRAYNEKGERFTRGASGFLAHVFQHEMDHLNGVLYTDKVMKLYDEKDK